MGWLQALARQLRAGTPEVVGLMGRNPFATVPPRYVRAVLYDYRFTTPEERRRTDAWWARSAQGAFMLAPAPAEPTGP